MGALLRLPRKRGIVVCASSLRVQAQVELVVPPEVEACCAQGIVPLLRVCMALQQHTARVSACLRSVIKRAPNMAALDVSGRKLAS